MFKSIRRTIRFFRCKEHNIYLERMEMDGKEMQHTVHCKNCGVGMVVDRKYLNFLIERYGVKIKNPASKGIAIEKVERK